MSYSNITPLVLEAAWEAVGAPAPRVKNNGTREEWRAQHTPAVAGCLPSEEYFRSGRDFWSPYDPEKHCLLDKTGMKDLIAKLKRYKYDILIVRNKRNEIIAVVDDYGLRDNKVALCLDVPGQEFTISDKGIRIADADSIESLATGKISTGHTVSFEGRTAVELEVHSHSKGTRCDITASKPHRKMDVWFANGGPHRLGFAPNPAGVQVILPEAQQPKQPPHQIHCPSGMLTSNQVIDDTYDGDKPVHRRNVRQLLNPGEGRGNSVGLYTVAQTRADRIGGHGADFIIRDQVRYSLTRPETVPFYTVGARSMIDAKTFGENLEQAARRVATQAEALRQKHHKQEEAEQREKREPATKKAGGRGR